MSRKSWLAPLVRFRIFGKSPINFYLSISKGLWNRLPASFTGLAPMRRYANFLRALGKIQGRQAQGFATFFLRNRAELELIRQVAERRTTTDPLRVAVLGCGTGPEAYSLAWRIQSARPDLKLILHAVDISEQALEVGRCGRYSLVTPQLTNKPIFQRMTRAEMDELFDRDGDTLTVKPWIREVIKWHVGDVGEPDILDVLGPQDIVLANNFLCHMDNPEAERCLRNLARLVTRNGFLFVSGIKLDVRTKVAEDLGWQPIQESLEEILNKTRPDWRLRYAAAFQLVSASDAARCHRLAEEVPTG